ncbi:MAG: sulfur carrier protein ThiS [Nitrospirae bacterium]|nr:MAG: sulfur carrier protein ThiS [Nitrospirota bacterium]
MKLTVNGEIIDDVKAGTISELLGELKVAPGRVAVEVNMAVIRKADHDTFRLHDGDVIEIVNFVGGGS